MKTNQTSFLNASLEGNPCHMVALQCDDFHMGISGSILILGIIALFENLLLVLAMNSWDLKKTCKMFWFLWHLTIADVFIASAFVFYHFRILSSCPVSYRCQPSYEDEVVALVVWFFVPILASHLFVVAATVDRFISIRWSLRYSEIVTGRTVRGVAVLVWGYSFSVPFIGEMVRKFFDFPEAHSIVVILTSSTCLISAAIVILLNIWMVVFAWRSLLRLPKLTCHHRRDGGSLRDMEYVRERLKLAVTLLLFVGSFFLSCLPWSFALVFCKESMLCQWKKDDDYTLVLVLLHTLVLPALYGFRVQAIKGCVKDYCTNTFYKVFCKVRLVRIQNV